MNRMRTAERICRTLAIVAVILVMLMQAGEHNGIALRVAAGAALLAIIADAVLSWQLGKQAAAAQESAPKQSVLATVVSRRTETIGSGRNRRVIWFLKFRPVEGGNALEFQVSEAEASRYDEGEEALLQYQGWQYLGFRRYIFEDTPREQPGPTIAAEQPADDMPQPEEDDGILTHELEE